MLTKDQNLPKNAENVNYIPEFLEYVENVENILEFLKINCLRWNSFLGFGHFLSDLWTIFGHLCVYFDWYFWLAFSKLLVISETVGLSTFDFLSKMYQSIQTFIFAKGGTFSRKCTKI